MNLLDKINEELKNAMKAKDQIALQSIRAIKSELLLLNTKSGKTNSFSDQEELKILRKLIKQRKESAKIFREQSRIDLAELEDAQAKIIERFLPEQLDEKKIRENIQDIILNTGSKGMKDMGKVMSIATSKMAGQANGKTISTIVKEILNS